MTYPVATAFLALAFLLPAANGQSTSETVTTVYYGSAETAKGADLRDQVDVLLELTNEGKFDEAEVFAVGLRQKFEINFNTKIRQHSFQSKEEYIEFTGSSSNEFEWIDFGYQQCLQMQAFIASARKNFPLALSILASIETLAPTSASTLNERGYVLNQLGNTNEALTAYRKALALAIRYASQRNFQATSLRGIGFALIELNRLDDAEDAYQQSLKVDPGNKLALSELDYIKNSRMKK